LLGLENIKLIFHKVPSANYLISFYFWTYGLALSLIKLKIVLQFL
jgi:hypothetical protein